MNKALRLTICIALMVVSTLIGLFFNIYLFMAIYRPIAYGKSMKYREFVCKIPEVSSGYAPQGIAYSEENDLYLLTGYAKDNESVLYVVQNGEYRRVYLADEDGNVVKGHAGGITCAKDFVYLANGSKLQIFSLSEILKAQGTDRVKSIGVKHMPLGAAFTHSDGINIYVGEFYRAGNYETELSHYYTTEAGAENKALITCFPLNADGSIFGDYPIYAVSIPGLVQGAAIKDGKYILSRSYGLKDSKLEYYEAPTYTRTNVKLEFRAAANLDPVEVPLYYLDDTKLVKRLNLPAFSEDLTVNGDRVVVTNENACNKYIVGKLFNGGKVYSYPLEF